MMGEDISLFEQAQRGIFLVVLIALGILFFACLLRAVKGPRVADRLVAVNMTGTMVMVSIAIFSLLLGEEYLLDICLIYAMASFLAVIVLTKVYIGVYEEQRLDNKQDSGSGNTNPEIAQAVSENETEKGGMGHEHLGMD